MEIVYSDNGLYKKEIPLREAADKLVNPFGMLANSVSILSNGSISQYSQTSEGFYGFISYKLNSDGEHTDTKRYSPSKLVDKSSGETLDDKGIDNVLAIGRYDNSTNYELYFGCESIDDLNSIADELGVGRVKEIPNMDSYSMGIMAKTPVEYQHMMMCSVLWDADGTPLRLKLYINTESH
jgi:hypothetical protein